MKFDKEIMIGLANEDYDDDKFEIISDKLVDSSRWDLIYKMIFRDKLTRKIYSSSYRRGATESQDNQPYEYSSDPIEVTEVEPHEEMIVMYRPVK